MSSASASIDLSSLSLGEVVTTGKGAKLIPLSRTGGEAVIWQPRDALTVLFEPSAYNKPDATRVNLCFAVASSLADFDKWCVANLAAESPRLFGSQLTMEEVASRYQPILRVREATGSQSLRVKISTTGRAAVRIWSPMGAPISAPPSWSQCNAKCRMASRS